MSEAPRQDSRRVLQQLVLNALADAVCYRRDVLDSGSSREVVREAFEAATDLTPDELDARIEASRTADAGGDAGLRSTVAAVLDELATSEASAVLDHRVSLGLSPVEVALYDYSITRDPDALAGVDLGAARDSVDEGIAAVGDGDYETAVSAFDHGIDRASNEHRVSLRALAGLASHWGGDDALAMDYVEEAMHLDRRSLTPFLVGLAADSQDPAAFRDGRLGVRLFVRSTVDAPPDTDVELATGSDDEWTDHEVDDNPPVLTDVSTETTLRLRLRGTVPAFPSVRGYYVGLGVVDLRAGTAKSVERIVRSGPETDDAVETLRFER